MRRRPARDSIPGVLIAFLIVLAFLAARSYGLVPWL